MSIVENPIHRRHWHSHDRSRAARDPLPQAARQPRPARHRLHRRGIGLRERDVEHAFPERLGVAVLGQRGAAPQAARVVGVAPTFCQTEGNMAALAELPERVREEIAATMSSRLGRVGVPDDIARVVLFAASDLAAFMTGSTILADAGEVC